MVVKDFRPGKLHFYIFLVFLLLWGVLPHGSQICGAIGVSCPALLESFTPIPEYVELIYASGFSFLFVWALFLEVATLYLFSLIFYLILRVFATATS